MDRLLRAYPAQGSTEYLVVLSVVLIIGLISVSLLSYFPGTAKGTAEASSNTYWQGSARPLRISEASQTAESSFVFALENADADPITLTGMAVDGSAASLSEDMENYANSSSIYLGPGEKKLVGLRVASFDCAAGQIRMASVEFSYNTYYGTSASQSSANKYAIRCLFDGTGTGGNVSGNETNSSELQINTVSIPSIYPHETLSTRLNATGGTPPYTWSKTSGSILTVWSNGGVYRWYTGGLAVGDYPQQIVVYDSAGANATRTIPFSVLEMPIAPCGSGGGAGNLTANPQPARFCQGRWLTVPTPIVRDGVPPYSYSVNSQTMPQGFSVVSCDPGDLRLCIKETGAHEFVDGGSDYVDVCVTDSTGTSVSSIVVVNYYNC